MNKKRSHTVDDLNSFNIDVSAVKKSLVFEGSNCIYSNENVTFNGKPLGSPVPNRNIKRPPMKIKLIWSDPNINDIDNQ